MKNLLLAIVLMCSTAVYPATDVKTLKRAQQKYELLMQTSNDAVSALKELMAEGFSDEVVFEIAILNKIDLPLLAPTAAGETVGNPNTSVPFSSPPASTFNGGGGGSGSRS